MQDIAESEIFDLIAALVEKSLVIHDASTGRYRLLETVRQYGLDRLLESGDEPSWRGRHLDYFVKLTESAEPNLWGSDQAEWLNRLETDHPNIRAALEWSVSPAVPEERHEAVLRICGAIHRFWYIRGHFTEGRAWLTQVLERSAGTPTALRSKALNAVGILAWYQGDYDVARAAFEENLRSQQALKDEVGIATSLSNLGSIAHSLGEYEAARQYYQESLEALRTVEDEPRIAVALANLGNTLMQLGLAGAKERLLESLALLERQGNRWEIANVLHNLAEIAYTSGDEGEAHRSFAQALATWWEIRDRSAIAAPLIRLGALAARRSDYVRAARLFGAVSKLLDDTGAPIGLTEKPDFDRFPGEARQALGQSQFDHEWLTGRDLSLDHAVQYALSEAI